MDKYKNEIIELIKNSFGDKEISINEAPNIEMGDFAIPCFSLSKELSIDFNEIFETLEKLLSKLDYIDKIERKGGYLNLFLKREYIVRDVLNEVNVKKDLYGSSLSGKGKNAIIEHTSINPNASPHIGRARNAFIGDCLVRLLKFEGYNVHTHYFVNDVGKQIAMLVLGARAKDNIDFKDLLNIYVDINNALKENSALEKEAFDLLYKFEHGDASVIDEFYKVVDICIKGQTKIFNELNINYDYYDFESKYIFEGTTNKILERIDESGELFEAEDGRFAVNLDKYNLPVLVVTRNDKTSLYPLRDLAYSIDKANFNYERNIIVLGEDQKLYFQQLASVLNLIGVKAPEVVHYSFVMLTSGKMSTRSGSVVLLEDAMDEAVSRVKKEMEKRYNSSVDNELIKKLAYGVVKYTILKNSIEKNVTFDWETALNFEGNTSLYIQYNYARICSILNKDVIYEKSDANINYSLLSDASSYKIIKCLNAFKETIQKASVLSSPHMICNYLFDLSKLFSKFYAENIILDENNAALMKARLLLIQSVKQVIKNGLNILGIDVVDHM